MIDINEECYYQLFNNLGQTVMQGRLTPGNQTLLTDALNPGSFVLRLSEGDKIQTFKLLKY